MKFILYIFLFSLAFVSCKNQSKRIIKDNSPEFVGWEQADSIKNRINSAIIPADTFLLTDLELPENAQQIPDAVNLVAEKGGGTLIIPKGTYNSAPIIMKSNIELLLDKDATIRFIPDPALYPLVYTWFTGRPCMNFSSMIYARNETNIKISGKGVIDGRGYDSVWKNMKYYEKADFELLRKLAEENVKYENRKFGQGHSLRPNLISFHDCSRISISGVTLLNTPHFILHPVMSDHITITNCSIKSKGYDQIGVAIESCEHMLIDSLFIEDIGEGIKILSGSDEIANNSASQNIIIQNSRFNNVTYAPVIFSSKSIKGSNRVFISGLEIETSETGICIYGQQGVKIHDILIKNVKARNIAGSFLYNRILRSNNKMPIIYNVNLENIQTNNCGRLMVILGHQNAPIRNITIENSKFSVSKGSFAKYLTGLHFDNVEINGKSYAGTTNIGDNEIPKIYLDDPEDEILDSDDIQLNDLPVSVINSLNENFKLIPVNDIDRIITSSNIIYEIDLELESFQDIKVLIQVDGEIIRSEIESNYTNLSEEAIHSLKEYLNAEPIPYFFNEITEIRLKDFTYYEIKGEHMNKLFALGISQDGKVIEKKQRNIESYISYSKN